MIFANFNLEGYKTDFIIELKILLIGNDREVLTSFRVLLHILLIMLRVTFIFENTFDTSVWFVLYIKWMKKQMEKNIHQKRNLLLRFCL